MSTYYYLICDRCVQGVPACSSVAGGSLMGDGTLLTAFIYEHRTCCDIRVVDEHVWQDISIPGPYIRFVPSSDE